MQCVVSTGVGTHVKQDGMTGRQENGFSATVSDIITLEEKAYVVSTQGWHVTK